MSAGADLEPPDQTAPPSPEPIEPRRPTAMERSIALLEVLICSDYPTQFALGQTVAALGYWPSQTRNHLDLGFVAALSLADTAVLLGLILFFIRSHGESARD